MSHLFSAFETGIGIVTEVTEVEGAGSGSASCPEISSPIPTYGWVFFWRGGSGGGVQVLCRNLQKCTGLFCGNKEDHLPYELHVHSYDLLDFVNMVKKACTNPQKCLKLCNW